MCPESRPRPPPPRTLTGAKQIPEAGAPAALGVAAAFRLPIPTLGGLRPPLRLTRVPLPSPFGDRPSLSYSSRFSVNSSASRPSPRPPSAPCLPCPTPARHLSSSFPSRCPSLLEIPFPRFPFASSLSFRLFFFRHPHTPETCSSQGSHRVTVAPLHHQARGVCGCPRRFGYHERPAQSPA